MKSAWYATRKGQPQGLDHVGGSLYVTYFLLSCTCPHTALWPDYLSMSNSPSDLISCISVSLYCSIYSFIHKCVFTEHQVWLLWTPQWTMQMCSLPFFLPSSQNCLHLSDLAPQFLSSDLHWFYIFSISLSSTLTLVRMALEGKLLLTFLRATLPNVHKKWKESLALFWPWVVQEPATQPCM